MWLNGNSSVPAILVNPHLFHFQKSHHRPHRACCRNFLGHLMPEQRAQGYGEVLWLGGRVTALTLISFIFMVRNSNLGEIP